MNDVAAEQIKVLALKPANRWRLLKRRTVVAWRALKSYQNPLEMFGAHRRGSELITIRLRAGAKIMIRPGTSDRPTLNEVALLGVYAGIPIESGFTVLDIGAHIGCFTVLAAKRASRVFAVEPIASNFDLLAKNIALNDLSNVKAVRAAVGGGSSPTVRIYSSGSLSSAFFENANPEEVRQISLGNLVEELGTVDVLKMDCEGGEFEAILSSPSSVLRKIDAIIMEYHCVDGHRPKELVDHLRNCGFLVQHAAVDWTGYLTAVRKHSPLSC